MIDVLRNRTYLHLFLSQVVTLLGTGLATVALGLLAYDLAGGGAAMVLGTVFTIKMIAYVGIAPVAGAFVGTWDRKKLLVGLSLIRALTAGCLPFVTEVWQIYVLIFVMQSASAAYTPTFQATIPDVLPDEAQYTRALSLSRLAHDLENIASPTIAALLLMVVSSNGLFWGTTVGFLGAGVLVLTTALPTAAATPQRSVYDRTTRGIRMYLQTPRLRGLLALNLAAAAAGAMVLINSVVLVRGILGLDEQALAWTMFAYGAGSMLAALALPRVLDRVADRPVMLMGAGLMIAALLTLAAVIVLADLSWAALLGGWLVNGLGWACVQTPSGRLLRRSAGSADRPALFAAQFALSHACWLICYPLAGWLMSGFGAVAALVGLASVALVGVVMALRVWPAVPEPVVQDKP